MDARVGGCCGGAGRGRAGRVLAVQEEPQPPGKRHHPLMYRHLREHMPDVAGDRHSVGVGFALGSQPGLEVLQPSNGRRSSAGQTLRRKPSPIMRKRDRGRAAPAVRDLGFTGATSRQPAAVGWCHGHLDKCRPVPRQLRLAGPLVSLVAPNPLNHGLPWDTPIDSLHRVSLLTRRNCRPRWSFAGLGPRRPRRPRASPCRAATRRPARRCGRPPATCHPPRSSCHRRRRASR